VHRDTRPRANVVLEQRTGGRMPAPPAPCLKRAIQPIGPRQVCVIRRSGGKNLAPLATSITCLRTGVVRGSRDRRGGVPGLPPPITGPSPVAPPSHTMSDFTVAFLGDVVGQPGRRAVEQQLPRLRDEHRPDVVVANVENARAGSGLSPSIYERLKALGIDAFTMGDHVYRDEGIVPILERAGEPILRPANLSARSPGKRFVVLPPTSPRSRPLVIVTVLGRIFFPMPADDPFACVDGVLAEVGRTNVGGGSGGGGAGPVVIVEAHMEATSEKIALANHVRGRVAAVIGSHTHVPTADARLLPGGTAFITDVGMCGPYDSIIGRDTAAVLRHMTTGLHAPFEVATGQAAMCGVVVKVSGATGLALSIERVEYRADHSKPPFV
jgi:metallophosphoesterase (TIGR00282 family)